MKPIMVCVILLVSMAAAQQAESEQVQLQTEMYYQLHECGGFSVCAIYRVPFHGFIEKGLISNEERVRSLLALETKVGALPKGAHILWNPYNLDSSGKPFLFREGQFDGFAAFCAANSVKLEISEIESTASLLSRLKQPTGDSTEDVWQKRSVIDSLAHRRAKDAIPALIAELADKRLAPWAEFALRATTKHHFGRNQMYWRAWYVTSQALERIWPMPFLMLFVGMVVIRAIFKSWKNSGSRTQS